MIAIPIQPSLNWELGEQPYDTLQEIRNGHPTRKGVQTLIGRRYSGSETATFMKSWNISVWVLSEFFNCERNFGLGISWKTIWQVQTPS